MSETKDNTQGQKPIKNRTVAVILVLVILLCFFIEDSGDWLPYVILIIFPLILLIISVPVAQKILKDGRKLILSYGCRSFGIFSIVAGTLTIWLSHYSGLLDQLLFGLDRDALDGSMHMQLTTCVLLALMGIIVATNGVCIGKNIKRDYGFLVSALGLVYNLAIFIFVSWNVWAGKLSIVY